MEKKVLNYRLIKCYPGYNELGIIHSSEIGIEFPSENKNFEWKGISYYDKYPEHWEKVVEKDYLITGYYLSLDDIHINPTGNFSKNFEKDYKIYQIKRKSDNFIFTIGDKINRPYYKDIDVIRGFNLLDELCLVSISDEIDKGYFSKKGVNISTIEHAKNVLFTTEDGVDIFEGDEYYSVNEHYWTVSESKNACRINYETYHKNRHNFSTKEKTKEYILLNKPCLTINDISTMMNNHRGNHSFNNSVISNLLKELVKTKL
jgi:hypothetical protein